MDWLPNGLPNHMIRPFENQTKVSQKSNVWILSVPYSDGDSIIEKFNFAVEAIVFQFGKISTWG